MLLNKNLQKRIKQSEIDLVFRRWRRKTVKEGGSLHTAVGVMKIHSVDEITSVDITQKDVQRAGFSSKEHLLETIQDKPGGKLYRIEITYDKEDPRKVLREKTNITDEEYNEIESSLKRIDMYSTKGSWTHAFLTILDSNDDVFSKDLAEIFQLDQTWIKRNIRKLKDIGLTESTKKGYRLSPRGREFWKRLSNQ
jgi:hypothetical protein